MKTFEPSYINLNQQGILSQKIESASEILRSCTLCPRECRIDRTSGETGYCSAGKSVYVASYNPHFGEETPLVGKNGSGTIFFTHCNLLCIFCQNYEISHKGIGVKTSLPELASRACKVWVSTEATNNLLSAITTLLSFPPKWLCHFG